MKFKTNKTYEIITPESAEIGDFEETGFDYEDQIFNLRELIDEIGNNGFFMPSEYPLNYNNLILDKSPCHIWISTIDPEIDYHTGNKTFYNLHITCTNRQFARILKCAGLI